MDMFEITDEQLNEVFDGIGKYPIVNLMPKTKVPYVINLQVPGSENLAVRFCNFMSKGDAAKQVKLGDKFMQTQVIQISEKGTPQILRDGLGSDPIGAMNMITDQIVDMLVAYRMDASLLMFPTKALKGQAKNIARIAARLLQKRSGGKFIVLPELMERGKKYTYIMMYRKSTGITSVKGLEIDPELYTVSSTSVGDVVIDTKTGEKVTKAEAIAASIVKREEKRSTKSMTNFKIPREELIKAFTKNYIAPGDTDHSKSFGLGPVDQKPVPSEKADALFDAFMKTSNDKIQNSRMYRNTNVVTKAALERMNFDKRNISDVDTIAQYAESVKFAAEDWAWDWVNENLTNHTDEQKEERVKTMASREIESSIMAWAVHSGDVFDNTVANYSTRENLSQDVIRSIENYTASGYKRINQTFANNRRPTVDISTDIQNLDKAFVDAGVKLPSDLTLWRGMSCSEYPAQVALENKMFYFSNYVSCSAIPIVFLGGSIAHTQIDVLNRKSADDATLKSAKKVGAQFAFAVKGIEVPALIIGSMSEHMEEREILLPRGTIFEFKKVSEAGEYASGKKKLLVECSAVFKSQIAESAEIYDGDAFMETGELKLMEGFSGFLKSAENVVAAKTQSAKQARMNYLTTLINIGDGDSKFVQAVE